LTDRRVTVKVAGWSAIAVRSRPGTVASGDQGACGIVARGV